jgi:hypothetical protein
MPTSLISTAVTFDTPRLGPLIDDLPEILVEPLALAEQRVEIRFYRARSAAWTA